MYVPEVGRRGMATDDASAMLTPPSLKASAAAPSAPTPSSSPSTLVLALEGPKVRRLVPPLLLDPPFLSFDASRAGLPLEEAAGP